MSRPKRTGPHIQVLLVEDDPLQRTLLRGVFQAKGHTVVEARNGAEALLTLAGYRPDVVVSDCRMPLLDGYQLCRLLKDDAATRDLPVLLLTAEGGGLGRFWAKTCGADRFFVKAQEQESVADVALGLVLTSRREPGAAAPHPPAMEEFGVDAIQRRLAKALEARLLETAMRDSIARLYTEDHDARSMVQGFMEILQDLMLPGCMVVAFHDEDGPCAVGIHGRSTTESERADLRAAVEDALHLDAPLPFASAPAKWEEERRRRLRDPFQVVIPAGSSGQTQTGALGLLMERKIFETYRRHFEIAAEELGRLLKLENARIRLYQQAIRDPLTGLFNRRHMMSLLDQETAQCERFGQPLCVLSIDLDHFKRINDCYGHPVGDQVLSAVAQRIAFGLRKVDRFGRVGGEEFLVICPGTDHEGGRILAERLLDLVSADPIPGLPTETSVTISLGMAFWKGNADTHLGLLSRADERLYQAKAQGRNRVVGPEGQLD